MNAAEKAASVRPVVWARRSVLRTAGVGLAAIAGHLFPTTPFPTTPFPTTPETVV